MKEFAPVTPRRHAEGGISYRKHPVAKPCREGNRCISEEPDR